MMAMTVISFEFNHTTATNSPHRDGDLAIGDHEERVRLLTLQGRYITPPSYASRLYDLYTAIIQLLHLQSTEALEALRRSTKF